MFMENWRIIRNQMMLEGYKYGTPRVTRDSVFSLQVNSGFCKP